MRGLFIVKERRVFQMWDNVVKEPNEMGKNKNPIWSYSCLIIIITHGCFSSSLQFCYAVGIFILVMCGCGIMMLKVV
jgi:hypothetical protein